MERFCSLLSPDVTTWETHISKMDELPFECIRMLGHGEQCSVYTISKVNEENDEETEEEGDTEEEKEEKHWSETYFQLNDVNEVDASSEEEESSEETSETSTESEEWTDVVSHGCVRSESAMGCVEVVAKRFSRLHEDVCYEGRHVHTKSQLRLESDAQKYVKWLHSYAMQRDVETRVLCKRVTRKDARFTGFITESLCHLLLSELVSHGMTPHLTLAFRAVECDDTGYLLEEHITGTLEDILESNPDLGAREVASLYFQVVVTLELLQKTCRLKHHDLHTENVFIKAIDDTLMWKGQRLKDVTHFSYVLRDGTVLYLPNTGFLVKLGDFGMASMDVCGRRLARLDLNTYSATSWGEWTSEFEGYEGYDLQMLCGSPPFEEDSWRCEDEVLRGFLRHMRRVVQGMNGKLTRRHLRPCPGAVSRVTPQEVLHAVFVDTPGEAYDFREAPQGHNDVVACLTDLTTVESGGMNTIQRKRRRRRHNKNEPFSQKHASCTGTS